MSSKILAWGSIAAGGLLLAAGVQARLSVRAAGGAVDGRSSSRDESPEVRDLGQHDFGRLVGATTREHDLRYRNDGSETWTVAKTWQDCGCVSVVSTAPQEVAPGDDLVVRIRINTEGQPSGHIQKAFHVLLQPGHLQLDGRAKAECFPPPHAIPSVLETAVPLGDDVFYTECTLEVPDLGDPVVVEVGDLPEQVQVDLVEVGASPPTRSYHVQVSGVLPVNERSSVVYLTLHARGVAGLDEHQASVRIPCYVRREAFLNVSPRLLMLPRGSGPAHGSLVVRDHQGRPLPTLGWEGAPPDALEVSYDAREGRLDVVVLDPPAAMPATLRLSTPDGHGAVVPVVFGRAAAR